MITKARKHHSALAKLFRAPSRELDIPERSKTVPTVIENPVEHDTNAASMSFFAKSVEGRVITKGRIDLKVVVSVVLVVRAGFEDEVEINRVAAEILGIVELLNHACQVAPKEVLPCGFAAPSRGAGRSVVDC